MLQRAVDPFIWSPFTADVGLSSCATGDRRCGRSSTQLTRSCPSPPCDRERRLGRTRDTGFAVRLADGCTRRRPSSATPATKLGRSACVGHDHVDAVAPGRTRAAPSVATSCDRRRRSRARTRSAISRLRRTSSGFRSISPRSRLIPARAEEALADARRAENRRRRSRRRATSPPGAARHRERSRSRRGRRRARSRCVGRS